MKTFSADLTALLDSGAPVERVELFKIGPCRNGAMIFACLGQVGVTYAGDYYDPVAFGSWSRGEIEQKIGLESNSTQLTVLADNQVPIDFPGTSGAAQLIDGIKFGLLSKAPVSIFCAYYSEFIAGYGYGATLGPTGGSLVETKFVGEVATLDEAGMTHAVVTVHDLLYLLNIQVPARVLQAQCSHVLYDAGCRLTESSFQRTGVVASITYPYQFATAAALTPVSGAGTFALGVLTWTSGKNAGLSSVVRAWTPLVGTATIQLDIAPLFPIQVGDAFTVSQGCDRTLVSCIDLQGSMNAYINYGGEPDVPVPETAIG